MMKFQLDTRTVGGLFVTALLLAAVEPALAVTLPTLSATTSVATPAATVPDTTNLQNAIDAKAKELADIQAKKEAVQREADALSETRQTLGRDVKVIDTTITQLTYAIRENELTRDKLGLEIDSLKGTIEDHRTLVEKQRETLGILIRELYEAEQEQPLMAFFRHGRFSESMADATYASLVSGKLNSVIAGLRVAQGELSESVEEREAKRLAKEREEQSLASRKTIVAGEREGKQQLILETKNREQVYAAQLAELQRVQDSISVEINKIETELRQTIDPGTLPTVGRGLLAYPVANPKLTQDHGATAFARTAYKSKWHNGVDFGAPIGTEVFAAESGIVINAGDQDAYKGCRKAAYGKFVVIKHGNGLTTLYGHLSKIQTKIGTRVARGEVVGYVGSTGYATGPHLHFTVFASQTLSPASSGYPEGTKPSSCGPMPVGGDLDPFDYLPA